MRKTVQYHSKEERDRLIEGNSDLLFIEEQNIKTGDFLIFTDEQPLEQQLAEANEKLEKQAQAMEKQAQETATLSADLQGFMDFYFSQ